MAPAQDTALTICVHAIAFGVASIANITITFLLIIHHLKHKRNQHKSLTILSLLVVISLSILAIIHCIISNNYMIPTLHKYIELIDNYCAILCFVKLCLMVIAKYAIWLFLLFKIKYSLIQTPFKLSICTFYSHFTIYTILAISPLLFGTLHKAKTYVAMDNNEYKLCFFSTELNNTDGTTFVAGAAAVVDKFVIQMILLYTLYSNIKKMEQFIANNQHLSQFYSQTNSKLLDTKNSMKKCFVGCMLSLIGNCLVFAVFALYHVKYIIALATVCNTLPIICSFDIKLCELCETCTMSIQHNNGPRIEAEREEYLRKMMGAYYTTPERQQIKRHPIRLELTRND